MLVFREVNVTWFTENEPTLSGLNNKLLALQCFSLLWFVLAEGRYNSMSDRLSNNSTYLLKRIHVLTARTVRVLQFCPFLIVKRTWNTNPNVVLCVYLRCATSSPLSVCPSPAAPHWSRPSYTGDRASDIPDCRLQSLQHLRIGAEVWWVRELRPPVSGSWHRGRFSLWCVQSGRCSSEQQDSKATLTIGDMPPPSTLRSPRRPWPL